VRSSSASCWLTGSAFDGSAEQARPLTAARVSREELVALVDERSGEVSSFLEWAHAVEQRAIESNRPDWSLRLANRPDIGAAEEAAALFPERWWGVVVFTAFGSKLGAATVAPHFQRSLPPDEARAVLDRISFPRGSVGHHRIQPAVKGARKALVAACADHELFDEVLHSDEDFGTRYWRLRNARCEQWGRTTCFDLLLRAGALGVGGSNFAPQIAYLNGSTGPKSGFKKIWGREITAANADWGEALLWAWTEHWREVADRVRVEWEGDPYKSGDFENALCIWQERGTSS
jgi:hypothetical protein